ncbi:MAG: hypothetical protein IJ566_08600 [Cardiobacteriaceae bacterium]|nr:hypothetical protein [Cardiobacteriaceae bacterium]
MKAAYTQSLQYFSTLYGQLVEEDRYSVIEYLEFLVSRRKKKELEQAMSDALTGENLSREFQTAEDAIQSMLTDDDEIHN